MKTNLCYHPRLKICLFKGIATSRIFHFIQGFQGRSRFSGIIIATRLAEIFENKENY